MKVQAKFNNEAKISLFDFINGVINEFSMVEIKGYLLDMISHKDFNDYFDKVVESIKPESEIDEFVLPQRKYVYNSIGGDLAIIAGLYYGDDLSLEHLEQDYTITMSKEQLRQEVMQFTRHILFGKEVSGVDEVGELQIEKEGLVPIMDKLIASGQSEQEQKNKLKECLRVYGVLSEISLQEAREAANRDPDVILARNTYENRGIPGVNSSNTSFVEKIGGGKKGGKSVGFSLNKS